MRRWPLYVFFSISILLAFQLFNSWGLESDLRYRIGELSSQLQDCSKLHTGCMEESLTLQEKNERYQSKLRDGDKLRSKLNDEIKQSNDKAAKAVSLANRTHVDVELCKAELQSLKNLELTKTGTLETLRLDKEALTGKIKDLEKEIEKLRSALTTKSVPNVAFSKVTPAAAPIPPKISPVIANIPINEPILEDNAKEEMEDVNLNDNNIINNNDNFDPQM